MSVLVTEEGGIVVVTQPAAASVIEVVTQGQRGEKGTTAFGELTGKPTTLVGYGITDTTDTLPEGVTNQYFTAARVRAAVLTGLSTATNAVISAADTVLSALGKLQAQITANLATITAHGANVANPHAVTKAQVGLGNVDNTSDVNKPVSTAQQQAPQNQLYTAFTTAGILTAYTLTPAPAIAAYAANQTFFVKFHVACGAAPTLAISGLATPPNLVKENPDGTFSNVLAGDIPINHRSRVTLLSATQAWVETLPPRSIGDNQTWQNLTASRSLSTTFTNSTGRTITVMLSITAGTATAFGISVAVGGVSLPPDDVSSPGTGFVDVTYFQVPSGSTYVVAGTGNGTFSLTNWFELR